MHRHPHILNAATNLLGFCFVIIGALKIANLNSRSFADEIAWVAAFLLLISIVASYAALGSNNDAADWHISLADWAFMAGLLSLTLSVLMASILL
jgi:hypothetical protein